LPEAPQTNPVIPAKAGTSRGKAQRSRNEVPAFAGMTIVFEGIAIKSTDPAAARSVQEASSNVGLVLLPFES
jgi:hypothetical protein